MKTTIDLIDVKTDDLTDYKKTSLLLVFPHCTGKCVGCQNQQYIDNPPKTLSYSFSSLLKLYNRLDEHRAVVCAGLEPFDTEELEPLFKVFISNDKPVDFVIYTGYCIDEIASKVGLLLNDLLIHNAANHSTNRLIIKYGRYDKDGKSHYSKILGVDLASENQRAYEYYYSKEQERIMQVKDE